MFGGFLRLGGKMEDSQFIKEVKDFYENLKESQEELGHEFEEILYNNLSGLYVNR